MIPVTGDILHENLGVSQKDEERVINDVSVVFHSAATVKFDEEMKWETLQQLFALVTHILVHCIIYTGILLSYMEALYFPQSLLYLHIKLPGMGVFIDKMYQWTSSVFFEIIHVDCHLLYPFCPNRLAVEMNVVGVNRMIQFCKKIKNLEVHLHI